MSATSKIILVLVVGIVFCSSSRAEEIHFQSAENYEGQVTEIHCYGRDLKEQVVLKIDFQNEVLLEPNHLSWIRRTNRRVIFGDPSPPRPRYAWNLWLNDGHMQKCMHTYYDGYCIHYQCYRVGASLFGDP